MLNWRLSRKVFVVIAAVSIGVANISCTQQMESDVRDSRKELEQMRKEFLKLNINLGLLAASVGTLADMSVEVKEAVALFLQNAFSEYNRDDVATKDDFDEDEIDDIFGNSDDEETGSTIPPGGAGR